MVEFLVLGPVAAGTSAGGWPSIGAVFGPGGWFDSAPGMPEAPALAPCVSELCWLRIACGSGGEFGLYISAAVSTWAKSTSAVAWARTLPSPTSGLIIASTCLMMFSCTWSTYFSWVASSILLPAPLLACSDSSAPFWSTTVTLPMVSSGTLEATR